MLQEKTQSFGSRLKWARTKLRLKVKESIIPTLNDAGLNVSSNRWYEWEKIGTIQDSRSRKMRLKEEEAARKTQSKETGQPYKPKRESAYYPPWPDELEQLESILGIRHQWLINGTGRPFINAKDQRATDIDPLFARLLALYKTLTEGQKRALFALLESFNNRRN